MKRYRIEIVFFLFLSFICPGLAPAEIDWQTEQTIKLGERPIDIAISERGTYLFALTDDGVVHAFDSDGNVKGEIYVGKEIDGIACGSKDNILLLKSRKKKEISKIEFEFIEVIDTQGAPFRGNADAPVVISVFTDYQCPYCARLSIVLDQVFKRNRDTVKIVSKNYPLPMHGYARDAAAAALAADKMGKFWGYHEALFESSYELSSEKLLEIAASLGLDADEFEQEMKSEKIRSRIDKDMMEADRIGITGTPTVFVNGRRFRGRTLEAFQEMIDTLLKKKQ